MLAILLAAGRGRRLGEMGHDIPKCLIRLGGVTLIERHREAFAAVGVDRLRVVVGYRAEDVREKLVGLPAPPVVETVVNEAFERGNLLSMRDGLLHVPEGEDVIIMDADVLYPHALLARLVSSPHATCVLLDGSSQQEGEEMMIGASGDRVFRFARDLAPTRWDTVGETVGFLKVAAQDLPILLEAAEELIADGHLDDEYESAYERFAERCVIGFERVDDLPWTEIDFPEDVVRAAEQVLPRVQAHDQR